MDKIPAEQGFLICLFPCLQSEMESQPTCTYKQPYIQTHTQRLYCHSININVWMFRSSCSPAGTPLSSRAETRQPRRENPPTGLLSSCKEKGNQGIAGKYHHFPEHVHYFYEVGDVILFFPGMKHLCHKRNQLEHVVKCITIIFQSQMFLWCSWAWCRSVKSTRVGNHTSNVCMVLLITTYWIVYISLSI